MEKNENDGAIYGEFVKLTVRHVPNFVTQWGRFIHPPPQHTQTISLYFSKQEAKSGNLKQNMYCFGKCMTPKYALLGQYAVCMCTK